MGLCSGNYSPSSGNSFTKSLDGPKAMDQKSTIGRPTKGPDQEGGELGATTSTVQGSAEGRCTPSREVTQETEAGTQTRWCLCDPGARKPSPGSLALKEGVEVGVLGGPGGGSASYGSQTGHDLHPEPVFPTPKAERPSASRSGQNERVNEQAN